VVWSDPEDDGDLDPVFCGSSTPMRVYRNNQTDGGGIETSTWWESGDLPQFGNTVDTGDFNGDGYPEIAVADNNQFGGEGRFKIYENGVDGLASEPFWESTTGGYGSHVSWIDLDLDGDLDLATGRWWDSCRIYENVDGSLTTNPSWQSATTSVIENMFWGDVDNDGLRRDGHFIASGDGISAIYDFGIRPIRSLTDVHVDNVEVSPSEYAVSLQDGWISFSTPPSAGQDNIDIRYVYSEDIDLGVTNWDPYIGNYIFLNDAASVPPMTSFPVASITAYPNPSQTWVAIRCAQVELNSPRLSIYDISGRLVKTMESSYIQGENLPWRWDCRNDKGHLVSSGVYIATISDVDLVETFRLIVTR